MIITLLNSTLVEQARNTDVIAFFTEHNGFTFTQHGGVFRCKQHPSLAVKSDRLSWYWHSKGVGGYGTLDYLIKVEGLGFREAVAAVTNTPAAVTVSLGDSSPMGLILPEKAGSLQCRLYDYLSHKRGIDETIVSALLDDGNIYMDWRGNVVFVGFDEDGKPRFASLRGTYGGWSDASRPARPGIPDCRFRMDCAGSDKRYGFHMTYSRSERLYVFESPIDAMSHASIVNAAQSDKTAWKQESRLSLAGTSDTALPKYLEAHPYTTEFVLCLDNDQAGRGAVDIIARKYAEKGYLIKTLLPRKKDWNEDLMADRILI